MYIYREKAIDFIQINLLWNDTFSNASTNNDVIKA